MIMELIEFPKTKDEVLLNKLFNNLYDRSGFDWWWDEIDDETKEEIIESLLKIMKE